MMALDFETTVTTHLYLPHLVQQVFDKYQKINGVGPTPAERAQLFTDLAALLGTDLLERALRLLDEWAIIIFYTSDRLRRIVELSSKRNFAHVVRVVPGVNYCKCQYFQRCVLQLSPQGEEKLGQYSDSDSVSFTCEHVLAQRLHLLLNQEPREQILTLEQFKYFHDDIYVD